MALQPQCSAKRGMLVKRRKPNPAKFERCVKKVKRSLKKARRPGNAYAICSSMRTNPTKWNPLVPLDPTSFLMTPNVLGAIEKEREKIARSFGRKKRKNGSMAYEAGKRALRAAAARHGTVNLTPSISQREEWGYAWGDFMRGWNAAKKEKANRARSVKRKNKGRANSVPDAEARYQAFHGRPSEQLVKVRTTLHSHDVLAGIGDLRKLKIKSANGKWKVTVRFLKPYPILSMNEAATQLYIEGGDQSVDLRDFGIKTPHEKEVLGHVTDVFYFTTKDHLRPEDGGTAVYHHKFGKIKPTMVYDVRNQLMEFAGGGYTIPDEGIDQ